MKIRNVAVAGELATDTSPVFLYSVKKSRFMLRYPCMDTSSHCCLFFSQLLRLALAAFSGDLKRGKTTVRDPEKAPSQIFLATNISELKAQLEPFQRDAKTSRDTDRPGGPPVNHQRHIGKSSVASSHFRCHSRKRSIHDQA